MFTRPYRYLPRPCTETRLVLPFFIGSLLISTVCCHISLMLTQTLEQAGKFLAWMRNLYLYVVRVFPKAVFFLLQQHSGAVLRKGAGHRDWNAKYILQIKLPESFA